jgi:hypothetical protein
MCIVSLSKELASNDFHLSMCILRLRPTSVCIYVVESLHIDILSHSELYLNHNKITSLDGATFDCKYCE